MPAFSGSARAAAPCRVDPDRAFELLDGTLHPSHARDAHEHVRHCATCRRQLAHARALLAVLGRQATVAAPAPVALRARMAALLAARAPAARYAGIGD